MACGLGNGAHRGSLFEPDFGRLGRLVRHPERRSTLKLKRVATATLLSGEDGGNKRKEAPKEGHRVLSAWRC
jgi:hypothetical protein